jgi:hypothetical protein
MIGADSSNRKRLHMRAFGWSRRIFTQETKVNTFYEVESSRVVFGQRGGPRIGARITATDLPSSPVWAKIEWKGRHERGI